eukprot:324387_1
MTSLLRHKYLNKAMITNLAVDGSESRHVLYGVEPQDIFINERKKYAISPYPVDFEEGKRVYPLAILEEMITTKSIQFDLPKCYLKPTVFLSVGMMDLKTLIPIQDESRVFTQMLSFEKNLNQILKQLVHTMKVNVVLLSLWEPFSEFYNLYDTPRDAFVMVLNVWMCKLFTIAADYKIPVLDLTRTINTYDRSHYGQSIFENSNKSTMFIIELMDHALRHHTPDTSIIYYGSRGMDGIRTQTNDITARNTYMFELKSRAAFKRDVPQNSNVDEKKYDTSDADKQAKKADKDSQGTHIILMGDSVLDNFYWLRDKTKDVRQQILDTFDGNVKVSNLAVDESTSEDVLYGVDPSWTYVDARKDCGLQPYPIDRNNDDKVAPLEIVQKMIDNQEIVISKNAMKPAVVLSIGGNDVRVLLFDFNMQTIGS